MVMKPSILTYSGTYFDFVNPWESKVSIEDIAHALSNIGRFTGHTERFYSVAQHSVWVANYLLRIGHQSQAIYGLMHDAREAYVGDVSSPLKTLLPEYKVIEERVHCRIMDEFGLDHDLSSNVKFADLVALATEKEWLLPKHENEDKWAIIERIEPLEKIAPLSSEVAKRLFIMTFYDLMEKGYHKQ